MCKVVGLSWRSGLHTVTLKLNQWFNWARRHVGLPYWSLSQYLKHKVKNAVSYITSFEVALAREAKLRDFDGVVCGHIHQPEIREINGFTYCNDGDWVESLSALVEAMDGELKLVYWHENAPVSVPCLPAGAALQERGLNRVATGGRNVPLPAPEPAIARSSVLGLLSPHLCQRVAGSSYRQRINYK